MKITTKNWEAEFRRSTYRDDYHLYINGEKIEEVDQLLLIEANVLRDFFLAMYIDNPTLSKKFFYAKDRCVYNFAKWFSKKIIG